MNKTILVVGGASVASLAAGAAGGYFFAKNKLGKEFDERLDQELDSVKRHHAVLLMQAKENKPSLEELAHAANPRRNADGILLRNKYESMGDYNKRLEEDGDEEDEEEVEEEEPLTDEEIAEAEQREVEGKRALTDYQGISTKGIQETEARDPGMIARNIFEKHSDRPPRPPRDESGRFVKPTSDDVVELSSGDTPPYEIEMDDFLANPFNYEQENLRYFLGEDTLLDFSDSTIDNDRVGELNLKDFVSRKPNAGDRLCVRNEGLGHDYEVQLMTEPLTEYLGLQED
jgi:hypothetical protein